MYLFYSDPPKPIQTLQQPHLMHKADLFRFGYMGTSKTVDFGYFGHWQTLLISLQTVEFKKPQAGEGIWYVST